MNLATESPSLECDHEVKALESTSSNTGLKRKLGRPAKMKTKSGRPAKTEKQKSNGDVRKRCVEKRARKRNGVCECPLHCTGPRSLLFKVRVCPHLDHDTESEFIAGDGGFKLIHAHHFFVSEMYVLNSNKYLQPWARPYISIVTVCESKKKLFDMLVSAGSITSRYSQRSHQHSETLCVCAESLDSEGRGPLQGACQLDLSVDGAARHAVPSDKTQLKAWLKILNPSQVNRLLQSEGVKYVDRRHFAAKQLTFIEGRGVCVRTGELPQRKHVVKSDEYDNARIEPKVDSIVSVKTIEECRSPKEKLEHLGLIRNLLSRLGALSTANMDIINEYTSSVTAAAVVHAKTTPISDAWGSKGCR